MANNGVVIDSLSVETEGGEKVLWPWCVEVPSSALLSFVSEETEVVTERVWRGDTVELAAEGVEELEAVWNSVGGLCVASVNIEGVETGRVVVGLFVQSERGAWVSASGGVPVDREVLDPGQVESVHGGDGTLVEGTVDSES